MIFVEKLRNLNLVKLTSSRVYLIFFFIICLISSYSFVNSTIPIYTLALISIIFNFHKLKFSQLSYIGFVALKVFILVTFILADDLNIYLKNIRYYFGFIIFYIFFSYYDFKKYNFKFILIFLISWVLIEILLINSIIDPSYIQPDYRDTKFLGFYYRPFSFNTNPTATATILIIFYYFIENNLEIYLDMRYLFFISLTILLIMSTTGYILFLIYLILKYVFQSKNKIRNYFLLFIFILTIYFISNLYPSNIYGYDEVYYNFEKISSKYIFHVFEYKQLQIEIYLSEIKNMSIYTIFFGSSLNEPFGYCNNIFTLSVDPCFSFSRGVGGDFSILNALKQIGILGITLIVFLIFLLKNNNMKYLGVYILFIISSLHYSAIFMPLGQVFLAYILQKNLK